MRSLERVVLIKGGSGETDASVASIAYSQEVTLNLQYPE